MGQVDELRANYLKSGSKKRRIVQKNIKYDDQTGKYVSCWSGREDVDPSC